MAKDLVIHQGRTWVRSWGLRLFGEPIPATWKIRAQARVDKGGGETGAILAEWSTDPTVDQLQIHAQDSASGTFTVISMDVPAEASSAWAWRKGLWDIEVYDPNADPVVVYSAMGDGPGRIFVIPEVTR